MNDSDRLPESLAKPKANGAYVDDAQTWDRLIHAIVAKPAEELAETWTVLNRRYRETEGQERGKKSLLRNEIMCNAVDNYEFYTVPTEGRDWWLTMCGMDIPCVEKAIKARFSRLYGYCKARAVWGKNKHQDAREAFEANLHPDWTTIEELAAMTERSKCSIYFLIRKGLKYRTFPETGCKRFFWLPDTLEWIKRYEANSYNRNRDKTKGQ